MTSKQRAYLKGLAMTMEPILQVGKSSITPEHTAAVAEALELQKLGLGNFDWILSGKSFCRALR